MLANDHPDCCGVAARLPKKPGIQKLTPPSSALAAFGTVPVAISASALQKTAVWQVRKGGIALCLPPLRVLPHLMLPPLSLMRSLDSLMRTLDMLGRHPPPHYASFDTVKFGR